MAILALLGKKIGQSQKFLEDGTRIPVTMLNIAGNAVVQIKTEEKDKYSAVQLGFGTKKNPRPSILGHAKKAGLKTTPTYLQETRVEKADLETLPKVGDAINAQDVFKPGDIVDVIGISKGKGFAGVVKRHHFKGGPRTHGQSDRERAPGSIGQTTTPGRVYKGKRMAGRMGQEQVTIENLQIADVTNDLLLIKGLVPGGRNSMVLVKKIRENKKFIPLYKEVVLEEPASNAATATSDGAGAKETKVEVKEEVKNAKS
jgi:large subunit ribosomal protein L3